MTPLLLTRSVALLPVSAAKANDGAAGAEVSTVTPRVPATDTLPARSVATALTGRLPSAGTSEAEKTALQVPPVATTVLVIAPQVTAMLLPASAEPVTVTPAAFSAALTTSSIPTLLSDGASGAAASMRPATGLLEVAPRLPAASI